MNSPADIFEVMPDEGGAAFNRIRAAAEFWLREDDNIDALDQSPVWVGAGGPGEFDGSAPSSLPVPVTSDMAGLQSIPEPQSLFVVLSVLVWAGFAMKRSWRRR